MTVTQMTVGVLFKLHKNTNLFLYILGFHKSSSNVLFLQNKLIGASRTSEFRLLFNSKRSYSLESRTK